MQRTIQPQRDERPKPSAGVVVAGHVPAGGPLRQWAERLLAPPREWTRGRNGWWRLPLLLWFGHILRQHLRNSDYESLFGGLNLAIHEAGHIVFGWMGELPGVMGGTIFQLLAPVVAGLLFLRQRDWFAQAVVACWLSTNLFSIARYAADARAQALPLVSPTSGDPIHDWGYLLGRVGMLHLDHGIGLTFRIVAVLTMLAGLAFGTWLVVLMLRKQPPPPVEIQEAAP